MKTETFIDSWRCEEHWAGEPWAARYAIRGNVEWEADADGLRVREASSGYMGASGSYGLTANVAAWLIQAIR